MTAEAYFNRLRHIDTLINADLEELARLRALMDHVPSAPNGDGIHGKGIQASRVETLVVKTVNLEKKITDEVDLLVDMKNEAWKILRQIHNPQQRIVLQEYYFNKKSLEETACCMFLSCRRVQIVKREGLDAAQKILNKSKRVRKSS